MDRATVNVLEFLRKTPILGSLSDEELKKVGALCRERGFTRGNVIFYEEDLGTSFYMIVSGRVKIMVLAPDGREHILGVLQEQDFFGEMSLLDGEPRSATAVALDDVKVLCISREDFQKTLHESPEIALQILVTLSRRLRKTDLHVENLAFLSAPGRVARTLLQLSGELGKVTPEGVVISHNMTRQELANMAGTSRETLTRVLMDYQEREIITIRKNQIIIHQSEVLEEESI